MAKIMNLTSKITKGHITLFGTLRLKNSVVVGNVYDFLLTITQIVLKTYKKVTELVMSIVV